MQKIHAWIYNPDNALFKGQSKRAALYELYCEDANKCDLYKECNSCLLQSGTSGCKFGRKVGKEGFTKRARNYYTWISKAKKDNADYLENLSTDNKYRGIFKTHGHWYLPYSFMHGIFGERYPLKSAWVAEEEMTGELLKKICEAAPMAMMGGVINKYQDEVVPKFIHDIQTRYPDLFQMLPDDQMKRADNIDYVGRKADIKTCAPGEYILKRDRWMWDGSKLIGNSMLFQPAKGKITIEIVPDDNQPVEITDNNQVTSETVFLD